MEQAVNTFQKGLNTDSHPMAQGNDSLTDALNATFVTMNENEIILQNDMGNRRIDNAFLPSGYQPVGMKEYGGIIYVAAYNPITNKSQVGSFPSPERKLSVTDGTFVPVTIKDWIEEFINSEGIVDKNFVLKPLTLLDSSKEYLPIHPGDKFTIYCNDTLDPNLISNYNNVSQGLVESPKNKLYTLSVGVLNSQNEFVDITSSLARWYHNNIHEFSNNESELYKFNFGYFIPKQTNHPKLTLDDQEFKKEREAIEANTYSYKLIGPLYLKIQLNHINKFNYIITGENGNYLKIRYVVDYNCPDYGNENKDKIDQYAHIDTLKSVQDSFIDLLIDKKYKPSIELINSSYNIEKNTYSVEYVCTYSDPNIWTNVSNNILHIKLSPKVKYEGNEYYIKDLTVEEDIDVSLLNSNTINIKEWRFTNDVNNKKSTLTYSFECYPDENAEFSNLQIKFYRVSPNGDISTKPIIKEIFEEIYSGRNTIELDWNEIGLDTKALYVVKLNCNETTNYPKGVPLKELSLMFASNNGKFGVSISDPIKGTNLWVRAVINPSNAAVSNGAYYWQVSGPKINNGQTNPATIRTDTRFTRECCINISQYATSASAIRIDCGATDMYGKTVEMTSLHTYVQYDRYQNCNLIPSEEPEIGYSSTINKKIVDNYWFLTTELLNDFYYLSSEEFVPNFCTAKSNEAYPKFNDRLIIKPNLEVGYEIISDTSSYKGGLIMKKPSPLPSDWPTVKYKRTQDIQLTMDGNNIISSDYPDCIYQDGIIGLESVNVSRVSDTPEQDDHEEGSGSGSGSESSEEESTGNTKSIYKLLLGSLGQPDTPEPSLLTPDGWQDEIPTKLRPVQIIWESVGIFKNAVYIWGEPKQYIPNIPRRAASTQATRQDNTVAMDIDKSDGGGGGGGYGTSSSQGSQSSQNESNSNNTESQNPSSFLYKGRTQLIIEDKYLIEDYIDAPDYINGFDTAVIDDDKIHKFFQIGVGFQNQSSNNKNEHVLTLKITDNIYNNVHESGWNPPSGGDENNLITDIEIMRVSKDGIIRFNLTDNIDNIASYTDNNHILYKGYGYCNFMSEDKPQAYHQLFTVGNERIIFDANNNNSKTKSRIWIRGVDGQIALVQTSGNSIFEDNNTTVKNKLEKLVYLTNNSGTLSSEFIVSDIVRNKELNEYIEEYIFDVNKNVVINNSNIDTSQKLFENPTSIQSKLSITINTQPFLDYLFNYRPNNIRNIWLKDGSFVDIDGNPLNPQCVYIKKNEKLQKVDLPLRYSSDVMIGDKNALLFYGSNKTYIKQRYDTVGTKEDHSKTYLDYSGINVLDLTNIP